MIGADVAHAAALLRQGDVVAIPTETVYGLAGNALNEDSVTQIFKVKQRPSFDPLIVHIHSLSQLNDLVAEFPEQAKQLANAFWPGPLTLILPKKEIIPDLVTSGLPFVGIRMPRHPLTRELLQILSFPLAAPSANPFTYVSPTTAQHVEDQLGDKIPYILDGGACEVGLESTIVSFAESKPKVLRFGGISKERIEEIIGPVDEQISSSNPVTPGQMDKHYATSKKLQIVSTPRELMDCHGCYTIGYGEGDFEYNLSPTSNLEEMARNVFAALRLADESNASLISVCLAPEEGLGRAINDRLRRASTR